MVNYKKYWSASDVYSFATVIWEVFSNGSSPHLAYPKSVSSELVSSMLYFVIISTAGIKKSNILPKNSNTKFHFFFFFFFLLALIFDSLDSYFFFVNF